jgi:hypothetical protein
MNNYTLSIPLQVSAENAARLKTLQETFAKVCNTLAPIVQETRCWNRVALHHMMYKSLREKFPQMGSQMICNAIYSVSRTSRLVFQSPQSPFNVQLMAHQTLPLLQFLPSAPVFFDRHTLSLKSGSLSMFTLDGRMRFELNMKEEDLNRFKTQKLHEIRLQSKEDQYTLRFSFGENPLDLKVNEPTPLESYLPQYIVLDHVTESRHHPSVDNQVGKALLEDVLSHENMQPKTLALEGASSALYTANPLKASSLTTPPPISTSSGIELQLAMGRNAQEPQFTTTVPALVSRISYQLHQKANKTTGVHPFKTSEPSSGVETNTFPAPNLLSRPDFAKDALLIEDADQENKTKSLGAKT